MPKRTDLKSILIIGAGPIIIGQGCEFDYAGVQACRALRSEGYKIILINSNPATIMTDPGISDVTYIEPIHWQELSKIIEIERPNAILPTVGGQVAINCAVELKKKGILKLYDVELIGASIEAIEKSEDRWAFRNAVQKIGLESPKSFIAHNVKEAINIQKKIGFPAVIRPSFTLGGSGGGVAYNSKEFEILCQRGIELSHIHTVLVEEYLFGWKEFEMEVVRDRNDNCIIVCTIENIDPMGIHTGDSITVCPAQTLTDKEYQNMRNAAIRVIREIGLETGGANVQFAVHPKTGRLLVIEMNPRVSRSSALASKATGFPIAKIAAKLAVGYTLDELQNDITNNIPASFEPTLDYVVTKMPRFNFEKFPEVNDCLTTQMKSVGEVMALGITFKQSLQKAICGLENGLNGLVSQINDSDPNALKLIKNRLEIPNSKRIFYIADGFRHGMSLKMIQKMTGIDHWFLAQIQDLIAIEAKIKKMQLGDLTFSKLLNLKKQGFSDERIAVLMGVQEEAVRELRYSLAIRAVYKHVDSCSNEFPTNTSYMYSAYEQHCESKPSKKDKILILGSGPNRIGQGIEFDYCCVHAAMTLQEYGYETIMINCNPETVSTDYDISDRLYFESLTLENILEIINLENPNSVLVQYGGQTPLRFAKALNNLGIKILGSSIDSIDIAEDRGRLQKVLKKLKLLQPDSISIFSLEEGRLASQELGYPLMIRPSYILGGQSMKVVYNNFELEQYLNSAIEISNGAPVLLDRFIENAIEVDVDAISDGKDVLIGGIMQHMEPAGIHSGDSTCSLPPFSLSSSLQEQLLDQVIKISKELKIIGPINVQFAIQTRKIYVIEVNPRVSRTVPFISKAIGMPLAKIGIRCLLNHSLKQQGINQLYTVPPLFFVKRPVFSFDKFPEISPALGPEMKSTGEVMGISNSFKKALAKSLKAALGKDSKSKKDILVHCLQDIN